MIFAINESTSNALNERKREIFDLLLLLFLTFVAEAFVAAGCDHCISIDLLADRTEKMIGRTFVGGRFGW